MRWLSKFSETWDSASHHLHILERLGHGIDADLDGTALQRTEVIGASADEASNGAGVPMFANGRTYPGVDVGEGTVNPFSSIGTLVPLSAEQLQQPAQFAPSLVSNADAVDFSSEGALAPDGHAASTPFNAANRGSALGTNDAEAFLRLHDSAYWSAMPLTSEDPALWQNFTASYLEAIAGISGTRDVSSSTRADSTLEQAMSSGVRSSMGPAMPTASIAA